jgi:hypothetical protein
VHGALTGEQATAGGPLGPITKAIFTKVWTRLFDDDPSNPIYLPRIIKDGYPPWNLPSYDPARPGGVSDPFPIPGVPQEVSDAACTADYPISPIATAPPALSLLNVMFTNLSVMSPYGLSFSTTDPVLTATVEVGRKDQPFTLATNDTSQPNYYFQVACCEPIDIGSRDCSDIHWTADAHGNFVATAYEAQAGVSIRVNVVSGQPLTVTILSVQVSADPTKVAVDFDVKNLPEWAQEMARIAVNEGVASGAIVDGLQVFLNSSDVKQHLETLINNELKRVGEEAELDG